MDNLLSSGFFKGSLGAPFSMQRGRAPYQVQRPIRSTAAIGQQLGDTAVVVTMGSFLRNLAVAGTRVVTGCRFARDCLGASGHPPAPAASGWDGMPLDGS